MSEKQRIVIVGSGNRVQKAVLPALHCLAGSFEVVSVVGRTLEKLTPMGELWQIPVTADMSTVDFSQVDLVFLAVNKYANPAVLQQLLDHGAGVCTLMIETPVLEPNQLSEAKLFKRFRRVCVAEDTIALPHWRMAKKLIDEGKIGTLKKIWLHNSGYRYHALSRLRHITGGTAVRSSRVFRYAGSTAEVNITLSGGVKATITEPHSRAHQTFLMAGSNAVLADFPIYPRSTTDSFALGNEVDEQGRLRGFTLNGEVQEPNGRDQLLFDRFPYDKVNDHSLWNLHKVRGLMELIAATAEQKDSPYVYPVEEGLYDTLAMKLMRRFPWFDPLSFFGGSLIRVLIRLRS